MPRSRGRRSSARRNYREYDSDSEDDGGFGLLTTLIGLFAQGKSQKRRASAGRPPKRKQPPGDCQNQCHCCHCNHSSTKKKSNTKKNKSFGLKDKVLQASTSTKNDDIVEFDSDDEVLNTSITETKASSIKNKVDTFFKALESDDEEFEDSLKDEKKAESVPAEKKTKDFYTIVTDSEDDTEQKEDEKMPEESTSSSKLEASTSAVANPIAAGIKSFTNTMNKINSEKKTEDLFAFVDDILNECNKVVDLTDDKPKENVPVLSLEDLKKRTDDILGGCASLMEGLKPKPKEPEKKESESTEVTAPVCPVCLEDLGGARQAMATLCGHMFCEPCLQQVVKTTKKCPSCRKGLTKTKYHPVYI